MDQDGSPADFLAVQLPFADRNTQFRLSDIRKRLQRRCEQLLGVGSSVLPLRELASAERALAEKLRSSVPLRDRRALIEDLTATAVSVFQDIAQERLTDAVLEVMQEAHVISLSQAKRSGKAIPALASYRGYLLGGHQRRHIAQPPSGRSRQHSWTADDEVRLARYVALARPAVRALLSGQSEGISTGRPSAKRIPLRLRRAIEAVVASRGGKRRSREPLRLALVAAARALQLPGSARALDEHYRNGVVMEASEDPG